MFIFLINWLIDIAIFTTADRYKMLIQLMYFMLCDFCHVSEMSCTSYSEVGQTLFFVRFVAAAKKLNFYSLFRYLLIENNLAARIICTFLSLDTLAQRQFYTSFSKPDPGRCTRRN